MRGGLKEPERLYSDEKTEGQRKHLTRKKYLPVKTPHQVSYEEKGFHRHYDEFEHPRFKPDIFKF